MIDLLIFGEVSTGIIPANVNVRNVDNVGLENLLEGRAVLR
jgi:hypothetical protein